MSGFGDFGRELPRHRRGCTCGQCRPEAVRLLDHQGFYAASFEKTVSREDLQAHLTCEMQSLARWIREEHGLIGHIKAAISADDQSLTLSITRDTVRTQGNWVPQSPAQVSFAAIVTNIDREQLRERVWKIYQAM